jgi:carbamoylphosphate synthase large subunit
MLNSIVLGGTNPHIELIRNLKERGYYTILVDYAENPLAKDYADEHILESSMDKDKVLEIAKDRDVDLVISTCSDQANVTACYVAEKLGLPAPYSYQTSLNVTNKTLMKEIMWANNIPTSRFVTVTAGDHPDYSSLEFPLVVKPADSYGSRGVRKANHLSEIEGHLKEAIEISKVNTAIVEEYVEGEEISVDCYVLDGKAHVIMLRHKHNIIDHSDRLYWVCRTRIKNL